MMGRGRLQPGKKTWVEVSTEKEETLIVDPYHFLYSNLVCHNGTVIADLKPGQRFHILIANLREYAIDLLAHQVVAYT